MNIVNPLAPISSIADELARPIVNQRCSDCQPADYPTDKTRCLPCPRRRLLNPNDEAAMIEYLKWALRPSPERRARVAAMRRERLSDAQFDANHEAEENGEGFR